MTCYQLYKHYSSLYEYINEHYSDTVSAYIFVLCYNESILLPEMVKHYKTYLPNCHITIYDNESTDNSVELAKSLGCDVISWNSNNIIDDYKYLEIKNNCWKKIHDGWVIMIDMDEWLCVTEQELNEEKNNGTTVLLTSGVNMIGESNSIDLNDINLHAIKKGVDYGWESKKLCFLRDDIIEIKYTLGAHDAFPMGNVVYSKKHYYNKHMCYLGLPFLINKFKNRYERAKDMQKNGLATHYTDNVQKITDEYNDLLYRSIMYTFIQ